MPRKFSQNSVSVPGFCTLLSTSTSANPKLMTRGFGFKGIHVKQCKGLLPAAFAHSRPREAQEELSNEAAFSGGFTVLGFGLGGMKHKPPRKLLDVELLEKLGIPSFRQLVL